MPNVKILWSALLHRATINTKIYNAHIVVKH